MSAEMGELSAHMKGAVLKGAVVEAVLAAVPEQTWAYDEDVPSGYDPGGTTVLGMEIPMKVRREIVAHVLLAAGLGE